MASGKSYDGIRRVWARCTQQTPGTWPTCRGWAVIMATCCDTWGSTCPVSQRRSCSWAPCSAAAHGTSPHICCIASPIYTSATPRSGTALPQPGSGIRKHKHPRACSNITLAFHRIVPCKFTTCSKCLSRWAITHAQCNADR